MGISATADSDTKSGPAWIPGRENGGTPFIFITLVLYVPWLLQLALAPSRWHSTVPISFEEPDYASWGLGLGRIHIVYTY